MPGKLAKLADGLRIIGAKNSWRAALYPTRKRFYSNKFSSVRGAEQTRGSTLRGALALLGASTPPEAPAGTYRFPGRLLAHKWHAKSRGPEAHLIELTCENALLQIAVLAPDLMRVRVSPTGRFPLPFSYAVARDDAAWPPVDLSVEETREHLWIRTERLHCRIEKAHLSIAFLDPDGTVINSDAAGAGWQEGTQRVLCWKRLPPDEHIYGLGEKTTPLDKHGLALEMWNTDPQTYDPGVDPIYSNIPFYLGLVDGRGYGLFFDNSARGRFDFGQQTPGISRFEAECGEMRYYLFYGPALTTVLERYTELTGRMVMPPLWALGYHQNRWSYYPEARVREIAAQFRERRIPCEAIHLDIDYMDGFRCFTWDPERFPDPAQLVEDLHAEGFKVVTMIDPGIKIDPEYWVHQDGLQNDVYCKYPNGVPFAGPVWPGECHFPDFTSPRVRAWWGDLYDSLVDLGIDGFWNDMNEPTVFGHAGDTFPDAVQHEWDGLGTDHREAHNVYGMQMARATTEGLMRLRPDERPLVITRSAWAGTQRYNMHWLGDNRSDWASLRNTIPLALNMGLSGIAFTGPDIGGFEGTPDAEMLMRWYQLGAFVPFFRNHTRKNTADQEPWAFGEICEQVCRQFIELRYHLLPYHYTAFWQCAQRGIPMLRPLALAFQDDPHVQGIDDAFMCGDAFLVAPVTSPGATSRRLYIPRGRWYDFWTGMLTAGPQIASLEVPVERLPLLVRAGSVVPAWPAMQYTGERPVDVLVLHVYPGDGESQLYEDNGHTWAFQEGNCRTTVFLCRTERGKSAALPAQVRIECSTEGAYTPSYERVRVAVHGLPSPPRQVRVDGRVAPPPSPPLCRGEEELEPLYDEEALTVIVETAPFQTMELDFED